MSISLHTSSQYRTDDRIYVSSGEGPILVQEYDIRGNKLGCKTHNMNFAEFILSVTPAPSVPRDAKQIVLSEISPLIVGLERTIPLSIPDALSCSICSDPWDSSVEMLSCGHSFHKKCITGDGCAICRDENTDKPKPVPNYALRDVLEVNPIDKAPIPVLLPAKNENNLAVASQHIEAANQFVALGKEEEALKEFKLAFAYTNRSEDYQWLPKALEIFAKKGNTEPTALKMALQKTQLAYLYLTKYQLEENRLQDALQSLSRCILIDPDLQVALQEGQRFNDRAVLASVFDELKKISDVNEAKEPLHKLQEALLTLPRLDSGENLIDTLHQLAQTGKNLSNFDLVFTVCQFVEQMVQLTLQEKKLTKKHLEGYKTTIAEIVSDLNAIAEKMKSDESVTTQCKKLKTEIQGAYDTLVVWSEKPSKYPPFDHFVNVRNTLNEMLFLFGQKRVVNDLIYSRGSTSDVKEMSSNEAAALQLIEELDDIHMKIVSSKAIVERLSNDKTAQTIRKNLTEVNTSIETSRTEKSELINSLNTAVESTVLRERTILALRRMERLFSKEGGLMWKLISPLRELYQASEKSETEIEQFLFAIASVSHFDSSKAVALYAELLRSNPRLWEAYAPLASLHTTSMEKIHIFLRGACHAIQAEEYDRAKEFCDQALALHKPSIPTEQVETFDNYLNELVFLQLYAAKGDKELLTRQLTLYRDRCCTPEFFQSRLSRNENAAEISVRAELLTEKVKVSKMLLRLNREAVEEYQLLRESHKALRAIDPTHPIEKVVRWSLRTLEVLMQKEKWDEAAPVAEELLSLWDQVEKPEFIQKHAHTFSTTLATYIQKQSAERVNLLMTHMNRSTATILQQFSSQSQQLLTVSSANSVLQNNLRLAEETNKKLTGDLQQQEQEIKQLEKRAGEVAKNLEENKNTILQLRVEIAEEKNRIQTLKTKEQQLTKERDQFLVKLDSRTKESEKLKIELEASHKKNSELQKELESSKNAAEELQNELNAAEDKYSELEELANKLTEQRDEKIVMSEKLKNVLKNILENPFAKFVPAYSGSHGEGLRVHINLSNMQLGPEEMGWFCKNLLSGYVYRADFSNNPIGNGGAIKLAETITAGWHDCRVINLTGCQIGDEGAIKLLEALQKIGGGSLEIHLSYNQITDAVIPHLITMANKHDPQYRINLQANAITQEGKNRVPRPINGVTSINF